MVANELHSRFASLLTGLLISVRSKSKLVTKVVNHLLTKCELLVYKLVCNL